jgi:hypothetical protein
MQALCFHPLPQGERVTKKEKKMNTADILVPPTAAVKVLNKTRQIKPFTIKQTIMLGRFINKIKDDLKLDLKSQKQPSELFLDILEKLNGSQIADFMEILLNTQLDETDLKEIGVGYVK